MFEARRFQESEFSALDCKRFTVWGCFWCTPSFNILQQYVLRVQRFRHYLQTEMNPKP